jgi:hypothetical protein
MDCVVSERLNAWHCRGYCRFLLKLRGMIMVRACWAMPDGLRRRALLVVALVAVCGAPTSAPADPVADFYRSKTISVLIGVGAGGEYDTIARLVARYIGRYIPGRPSLVPQNMTGASGLKSMNYLATLAPHDGTYIGMISEGLPSLQAVGMAGVQFDAAKFNWLGAIAPTDETVAVWHTAGITTFRRRAPKGHCHRRDGARLDHLYVSGAAERAVRQPLQAGDRL